MTNEMKKEMEITGCMGILITIFGICLGSNIGDGPIGFHDTNWQLGFYIGLFVLLASKFYKLSVGVHNLGRTLMRQYDFGDFARLFLDGIEIIIYGVAVSNLFELELLGSFVVVLACYLLSLIIILIYVRNHI